MRRAKKLRSLVYFMAVLFFVFYIVSNAIPAEDQRKMRDNLFYVNNQVVTDLEPDEGDFFPEEPASGAPKLDTIQRQNMFQRQNISDCRCSRKWMYPPTLDSNDPGQTIKRLHSSCSDEGTHYQTNQNVISFSMYYPSYFKKLIPGSPQTSLLNYQIGLLKNLLKLRTYYPGFSLRVYTSVPLKPRGYFCKLLCQNEDIFWCDIRKTPGNGDLSRMNFRTWRFLPLGDPTVKIFHSRDLHSLISVREAAAARDWLTNSEKGHKAIMVMRDHKIGHNLPILAGLWGADNSKLNGKGDKLRKQMISISQKSSAQDKSFVQQLLSSMFYLMATDILAYDSYNCVEWSKYSEVRPFPVRRGNPATDFVGNGVNFDGDGKKWNHEAIECPLECRPSNGIEWIYC